MLEGCVCVCLRLRVIINCYPTIRAVVCLLLPETAQCRGQSRAKDAKTD